MLSGRPSTADLATPLLKPSWIKNVPSHVSNSQMRLIGWLFWICASIVGFVWIAKSVVHRAGEHEIVVAPLLFAYLLLGGIELVRKTLIGCVLFCIPCVAFGLAMGYSIFLAYWPWGLINCGIAAVSFVLAYKVFLEAYRLKSQGQLRTF